MNTLIDATQDIQTGESAMMAAIRELSDRGLQRPPTPIQMNYTAAEERLQARLREFCSPPANDLTVK